MPDGFGCEPILLADDRIDLRWAPRLTIPLATREASADSGSCECYATHLVVVPRAADNFIAPRIRKPIRARPTSRAALPLPLGIGLLVFAERDRFGATNRTSPFAL